MKLTPLTNENKCLQSKMRFFADYFNFVNEYVGKLPELPFDNPLSICDKIVFQIEANPNHFSIYIENHFKQLFGFYKNTKLTKSQNFIQVKKAYNEYHRFLIKPGENKSKEKLRWIRENPTFLQFLKALRNEYEQDLFSDMTKALYSLITCSHPLTKHIHSIKFCTHLLVTILRFQGQHQTALSKLMERIISKDIYEFPFPIEINELGRSDAFKEAAKSHLLTSDFRQQFNGITNSYRNFDLQKGYFLYAVDNCNLSSDVVEEFSVKLSQVTFISPSHKQLKALSSFLIEYDKKGTGFNQLQPKFFGKKKLIAFVQLSYENAMAQRFDALEIIKTELEYLNKYSGKNLVLNETNFLFTKEFETDNWQAKTNYEGENPFVLNNANLQEMNGNAFEKLRNIDSVTKQIILENEHTFMKASKKDISFYWLYVENLFKSINQNNKRLRRSITNILLKRLEHLSDKLLVDIIYTLHFFIASEETTGLSVSDSQTLVNEIIYSGNYQFDISNFNAQIRNDFVLDALKYHSSFTSNKQALKWRDYFDSLLLELMEFRNSDFHAGKMNKFSKIKFESTINFFINQVRWEFIYACIEHPNLSLAELTKQISV